MAGEASEGMAVLSMGIFHKVTVPLHDVKVFGVWLIMASWPWLSWRFFDSALNISLGDRYILAVYLYALGFMLHKAIIKPSGEKADTDILPDVAAIDENLMERLTHVAPLDDRRDSNCNTCGRGLLECERQVGVKSGDADIHIKSLANVEVLSHLPEGEVSTVG
ncbi:MAG: hypothetical protein J0M04_21155 [Verrucomicrobia bacterium]|nr:hypothetical protein [Verrucomicrobiota bacterium]